MSTPHSDDCRFCEFANAEFATRFGSVYYIEDGYAVTPGHLLIIPVTHRETYFDLTDEERRDTERVLRLQSDRLRANGADGFNIGWNAGEAAGQTVMHAHCHLIPRRHGDMDDPRGGVRGVIPERQKY
ncbi:HIT family protein [Aeromicrobium sp. 179-A 4D2 NHS]|uniref:HIT family protein n=1 Tax=Aeromicrobium sp. 179-A 4D2 NHS TaxID=3142375 RepID=UPI0039A142A2